MPEPSPFIAAEDIPRVFDHTTNVASSALDTRVLSCSDDYFAAADNLLNPKAPIHRPGVFVHTGAWYDGWETRRHNPNPYDWVVIKLGVSAATIKGVEVDTGFFVGNFGEKAELQAIYSPHISDEEVASVDYDGWKTIMPPKECGPSQRRAWELSDDVPKNAYTHVRLLMYPDGGFGRLRLYGNVVPPPKEDADHVEELSSALLGGLAIAASNQHFTPISNLLLPGRGKDMGDGWETKRSRGPDHVDWAIVKLGIPGSVNKIVVDTKDFRGNYPSFVRVHAIQAANRVPTYDDPEWIEVLKGDKKCQADTEHVYVGDDLVSLSDGASFTHLKLTMVPDGGVKRFRVYGKRSN